LWRRFACTGNRRCNIWTNSPRSRQSGSALLAVLWLAAGLAAIGISVSATVRGETERVATAEDSLKAYYLASGGVERAALDLLWQPQLPPEKRAIPLYATEVVYPFPTGMVRVEIIPETSKADVNNASPELLYRIALAVTGDDARAREIAEAIVDWRIPSPQATAFDQYYSSLVPSFLAAHSSIREIEELLLVKGVTPDIFYGSYALEEGSAPAGAARLAARPGLMDCLSVFGTSAVDLNTVSPALLAALGLDPGTIAAIVARRQEQPFKPNELTIVQEVNGKFGIGFRIGGNTIFTLRATARLRQADGRFSDVRRTVGAMVKYMPSGYDSPLHILRWYDTAWSDFPNAH
jgi:general secretion pathway protein K